MAKRNNEVPAYTLRVSHRGRTIEIGPFRSEAALRAEAKVYRDRGATVKLLRGDTSETRDRDDDDDFEDEDEPRRRTRRGTENRRSREDVEEVDELDDEPDRPPRDTHPFFKDLFTR